MSAISATSVLILVGLVLVVGYSAMPMPAGQLKEHLKNANNENGLNNRMKRETGDKLKAGDQKLKGGSYYYAPYYYDSYNSYYNSYYDSYYDSNYYDSYYYDSYYRK